MTDHDTEWELRVQLPSGWIEFAAHPDDASAESAFAELIEPHRAQLEPAVYERCFDVFRAMRAMAQHGGFQMAGAVLTAWGDEPTVWTYGVRVLGLADRKQLSLTGLLERVFRARVAAAGEEPEDFETIDGRVGTSLFSTLEVDPVVPGFGPLPDGMSTTFGACVAAVPLPGLPDAAALIVGAAPDVEQRDAMSVIASVLAHSVHVVGDSVESVEIIDVPFDAAFGLARP